MIVCKFVFEHCFVLPPPVVDNCNIKLYPDFKIYIFWISLLIEMYKVSIWKCMRSKACYYFFQAIQQVERYITNIPPFLSQCPPSTSECVADITSSHHHHPQHPHPSPLMSPIPPWLNGHLLSQHRLGQGPQRAWDEPSEWLLPHCHTCQQSISLQAWVPWAWRLQAPRWALETYCLKFWLFVQHVLSLFNLLHNRHLDCWNTWERERWENEERVFKDKVLV